MTAAHAIRALAIRALAILAFMALCPPAAAAGAEQTAARAEGSRIATHWLTGTTELRLALDRPVPFRVFTLDAPMRVVIDLGDVAWGDLAPEALGTTRKVAAVRMGRFRPGWSRMVLDLAQPLRLDRAEMQAADPGAVLALRLVPTDPDAFAAAAGPPPGAWDSGPAPSPAPMGAGPVTVVIDPGHGGIDGGAVVEGVREADVVLDFARVLREVLLEAGGFRVVLTRDQDVFLSLAERVAIARAAGADAFLSVHTNALDSAAVRGAMVFTRSERGSDSAAAARAATENRADLVAGLPAPATDPVDQVLADLARLRTAEGADRLARILIDAMRPRVAVVPSNPVRSADFAVLAAPDVPSVLVELGFLSNPDDRAALADPAWQRRAAEAIAAGLELWLAP